MSVLLDLRGLSVSRGGKQVLGPVDLRIAAGECVGLIGPNGAGKTTLMRAALGLIPHQGRSSLSAMPLAQRARQVAFLPQGREIAWPVSVETLVALGRAPHGGEGPDHPAVTAALARMGLTSMRQRRATELSGGEQARVLLARALAQDVPLLIADEPAAGLDPRAQMDMMQMMATLAEEGRSSLVSLHDLGLAARHCTRLVLVADGQIRADGPPEMVLSTQNLAEVFGIRAWRGPSEAGFILQPLGPAQ